MIQKLLSICRIVYHYLRNNRKIHFGGLLSIYNNVTIKIISGKVRIGKGVALKPGNYFSILNQGELTIGEATYLGRNCTIVCRDSISIGEKCGFGPNVTIYDHDHCFGADGPVEGFRTSPVTIGNNCWIGAGVIILRGARIGEGCVIGAGAVVRGDIPPYSLVTSNRTLEITALSERYK